MPAVHDSPTPNSGAPITELHPEHLFDKLGAGRLSPVERRQLRSHAARCEVCRFELLVRGDLALEGSKRGRAQDSSSLLFATDG